jgi:hypothetical protein
MYANWINLVVTALLSEFFGVEATNFFYVHTNRKPWMHKTGYHGWKNWLQMDDNI